MKIWFTLTGTNHYKCRSDPRLHLPYFISLPPGGIIYRSHVFTQDCVKGFFRIPGPVQFLPRPYGMQIVPPARLIQFVDPFFSMDQLVKHILIIRKTLKERIPLRQPVALGGIQRRIHRHQVPQLIIHHKRPGDKMIDIIFPCYYRFPRKHI